jgi:molybdopterin converting factor small subunit
MRFSIMDQTGHSSESFDPANKTTLEAAMARFAELTGGDRRYTAAAKHAGKGDATVIKAFDATADEILFIPPLQGG